MILKNVSMIPIINILQSSMKSISVEIHILSFFVHTEDKRNNKKSNNVLSYSGLKILGPVG